MIVISSEIGLIATSITISKLYPAAHQIKERKRCTYSDGQRRTDNVLSLLLATAKDRRCGMRKDAAGAASEPAPVHRYLCLKR